MVDVGEVLRLATRWSNRALEICSEVDEGLDDGGEVGESSNDGKVDESNEHTVFIESNALSHLLNLKRPRREKVPFLRVLPV